MKMLASETALKDQKDKSLDSELCWVKHLKH